MTTPQLILMRHAKSDWHTDAPRDFDRPLNSRGFADAPRVGRWMHFTGLRPKLVVCSSAVRARQTLEGLGKELKLPDAEIQYSGRLYHANESEVVDIATEALGISEQVMLIGHNPGFEMALLHYCPDIALPEDRKLMPTACVAVIEFADDEVNNLRFLRRPEKV